MNKGKVSILIKTKTLLFQYQKRGNKKETIIINIKIKTRKLNLVIKN